MWEFIVCPGKETAFEQIYGPEGDWAQCFRQSNGYLGTELHRDLNQPRRYVTSDFWESPGSYETFKRQFVDAYQMLDQKCSSLTEKERELGRFERVTTAIRKPGTGN